MRPALQPLLRLRILDSPSASLCRQCNNASLGRLPALPPPQSIYSRSIASATHARLTATYFSSNNAFERNGSGSGLLQTRGTRSSSAITASSSPSSSSSDSMTTPPVNTDLPHRRRQARRKAAAAPPTGDPSRDVLPSEDASSALTTVAAKQPTDSLRRRFSAFLSLTKPRLTVLVVLTAMAPYALYPVPAFLTPAVTESTSLSPLTLLFLTTGTFLCSAAANSLNMLYESASDAKMTRTRNRPLVRNLLSHRSALLFAALCAVGGTGALYFGVNPTVSFLGASNIVLYAGVYTPFKAFTVLNTWIGAVVGGIPPLMGWAAAAGESATGDGSWRELLLASDGSSLGGWIFGGFMFAWQFPHFMALSWSIREEYKAAGLRMLAWTNPARNARVALRYSIAFFPLCFALCAAGVTEWTFAVTSTPINAWLTWQAVRFWRLEGHRGSARGLFWTSVWHLPGVFVLALVQKKGMWGRVWRSIVGEEMEDQDEWEEDELDEMPVVSPTAVATAPSKA